MPVKQKKAAPEIKTYEKAQAVELTKSEKEKLSRALLLKWFSAKKYEKLKGLQEQLISLTVSEQEELKRQIIENTKKELKEHKDLTEAQIQARAEKFAEELFKTVEGIGTVKTVVEAQSRIEEDEKAFYGILGGFVNSEKQKGILKKFFKDPKFKRILAVLSSQSPEAAKKVEFYMKKGDYENLKRELVESSKDLPFKIKGQYIDQLAAMAIYNEASYKKVTGIGTIDKLISWLDKVRYVGHGFILNRAAKDLGIPTMLVIRLGKYTLRELKTQNELLQRHRHLIADKENKSKQDQERLVFIDAVNSIVGKIDQKQREKDLQSKFETALGKYLDGKEGLSEEDKMHLKQAAKFEDLRILNIFTLIYAEDKDREKVFAYSMSRVSKMYKNVKAIFGEDRIVRRTMRKYHTRRIISWAREMLTKNAGTWKLREIVGGLESLERKISASSSKIDDLYRRVEDFGKYEKNRPKALDPKKLLHEELLEHDLIHKEYEKLVRQATKAMSGQAQDMIEVGKRLEVIRKGAGKGFLTKALSDLPHISDDSLRKLFPNAHDIGKLRKTLKGGDLIRAYTDQIVNLKTMQDVTRTRFAHLANTIEETVAKPFSKQWAEVLDKAGRNKELKRVSEGVESLKSVITPKGKMKWAARNLTLPAIVIGAQAYNLFNGKTQSREALWDLGEAAAGFVPFVGTALDVRGAIMGESLSGKKLSTKERAMYAVFATIGVVADVGTLLGGWGLGIRAGLGGMRTGRRAVKIGREGKAIIHQTESARKLFGLQGMIARGAQKFNKLSRAERATDLIVAGKAMEQARLMDRLKGVTGFEKASLTSVDDIDKLIKLAKSGDELRDLRRLKTLMHETGVGIDYLKIAKKYGKAVDLPEGFFGKLFFRSKESFIKIKAKLLKIGIAKETIHDYERTFDAVQAAKLSREAASDALIAYRAKKDIELAQRAEAFKTLHAKGSSLGHASGRYADIVVEHRKLVGHYRNQRAKYVSLKTRYDKLVKSGASEEKVEDAYNAMKKAEQLVDDTKKSVRKIRDDKAKLKAQVDGAGRDVKKWRENLDKADRTLAQTENGIFRKQEALRLANEELHFASRTRSMLELEIMNKAANFARANERLATVSKYLQLGGLSMGAVWVFSGFNYGPAEQIRGARKVARGAVGVGERIGKVYFESNAGKPPIDRLLESRMKSIRYRNFLKKRMEEAASEGKDPAVFLAENSNTKEGRELASKMGLTERVNELISKGKVKVKKMAQQVRGRGRGALSKAKDVVSERLGGLKS